MKKIILCLALFTIFSLGLNAQLLPPYISVYQTVEGLSFIPSGKETISIFTTSTFLELTLGKKVFFTAPLGMTYEISDMAAFCHGAGIGFNLFDNRDSNFKGSSLRLSLLYSGKYFVNGYRTDILGKYFILAGGQLNLTYLRHYYKNFALRVGGFLGVYAAGEGTAINYGLSLGLAF